MNIYDAKASDLEDFMIEERDGPAKSTPVMMSDMSAMFKGSDTWQQFLESVEELVPEIPGVVFQACQGATFLMGARFGQYMAGRNEQAISNS